MKGLILTLLVLMTTALAGCTSSTGPTYVTPDMDDDGNYIIHVGSNGNTFVPKFAEVPAGSTVRFVMDGPGHNVVSEDGAWTESAYSQDFFLNTGSLEAGVYDYFCTPHKNLGMIGSLRVFLAE